MSKQMIKILGVLLSVCFLMSTTAAAWSSSSGSKEMGMEAREAVQEKMLGKISEEKGLYGCKNIFIRNLIIAKNIIVVKIGAHPLLRAMLLKKAMMGKEGMMNEEGMGAQCGAKLALAKAVVEKRAAGTSGAGC